MGYIGTAILAVVFLALGALVQYGSPETVEMVGGNISHNLSICMQVLLVNGLAY